MGKNSEISWTHHTFNPWWGCAKVSGACLNCYAADVAHHWARPGLEATWGPNGKRQFFKPKHWREPLTWNANAAAEKTHYRVFCASMADVFEDREDLNPERRKLWDLIEQTPNLHWLLLTKRIENVARMVPWKVWPENVWLGATIEDKACARRRLPILLSLPARIRFISSEPLLEDIAETVEEILAAAQYPLDWIIAGGESGPKARKPSLKAFRKLRDLCRRRKIPFHFKQWGQFGLTKTGEFASVGKIAAGRTLDGEIFDAFPI